jgi:hypothetical protein
MFVTGGRLAFEQYGVSAARSSPTSPWKKVAEKNQGQKEDACSWFLAFFS